MMLPKGTTVAVADGEKLNLFRNSGDEATLNLAPAAHSDVDSDGQGSGSRQNSSGNPDASQSSEDGFSAGIVAMLNKASSKATLPAWSSLQLHGHSAKCASTITRPSQPSCSARLPRI